MTAVALVVSDEQRVDCTTSLVARLSIAMSLYPGTPYNYSAMAQGLVFTAGACPLDEAGAVVAPGDFEAQALRTVENLLAALSTRGVGPESLLKTTVFVVARDRRDLVRVWDVVSSHLGRVPSTLLGVSLLGYPDQLVEIEAIASVESGSAVAGQPGAIGRLPQMTAPRLYYMPRTRSSRVLWLLEEIGAPYDLTEISGAQRRSDEHLLRHPLGRVPALQLGDGATMFESAAICLQLADLNPTAGLIGPVGSTARGLVYQWVVFAVSELEGPLFRWIRELGEGVTESPSYDRFADAAGAMQAVLAEHDWLVDDRFTVADVMCGSVLQGANARGLLEPWPALEAYVHRGEARPAYARAAAISDRPRT